eukprot:scaffold14882_cov80-Cyclotella_meneghiniana.AAC.6
MLASAAFTEVSLLYLFSAARSGCGGRRRRTAGGQQTTKTWSMVKVSWSAGQQSAVSSQQSALSSQQSAVSSQHSAVSSQHSAQVSKSFSEDLYLYPKIGSYSPLQYEKIIGCKIFLLSVDTHPPLSTCKTETKKISAGDHRL